MVSWHFARSELISEALHIPGVSRAWTTAAAERAGTVQLLEASEVTEVARSQDSPQLSTADQLGMVSRKQRKKAQQSLWTVQNRTPQSKGSRAQGRLRES